MRTRLMTGLVTLSLVVVPVGVSAVPLPKPTQHLDIALALLIPPRLGPPRVQLRSRRCNSSKRNLMTISCAGCLASIPTR